MVTEPGSVEEAVAARQAQIGASWFNWIAGLTLINVVTALFGLSWTFLLSLLLPIAIAEEAHKAHSDATYTGTAILTLLGVGLFLLFGQSAKKGARWAFVTGLIFYGIDALFWLGAAQSRWLGLALHAYALWRIGGGLGAANRLAALRRQSAPQVVWAPPQGQGVNQPDPQQWPPAPTQTPPVAADEPARQDALTFTPEIGLPDTRIDAPDTAIDTPSTRIDTRIDAPDDRIGNPEV